MEKSNRVSNLKFARNLKFTISNILVNVMKKMKICLKIGLHFLHKINYVSIQEALIYCTFNKSHLNSFISLVFPQVANFRYVANFRLLTLTVFISLN